MPKEEKAEVTTQQESAPTDEKQDAAKWDQLMAKLDEITETLRKACEGEPGENPEPEGSEGAPAGEHKPEAPAEE